MKWAEFPLGKTQEGLQLSKTQHQIKEPIAKFKSKMQLLIRQNAVQLYFTKRQNAVYFSDTKRRRQNATKNMPEKQNAVKKLRQNAAKKLRVKTQEVLKQNARCLEAKRKMS